jgi:hypothetical protein
MSNEATFEKVFFDELRTLNADLIPVFPERDAAARFLERLPKTYRSVQTETVARPWELVGLWFLHSGRFYEAVAIFWRLYQQMVEGQQKARCHKGMPLVWLSECYRALGFSVHAKRYLMLTLCEDAIREQGSITPNPSGIYFRLVWLYGLPDYELRRYASEFYKLSQEHFDIAVPTVDDREGVGWAVAPGQVITRRSLSDLLLALGASLSGPDSSEGKP